MTTSSHEPLYEWDDGGDHDSTTSTTTPLHKIQAALHEGLLWTVERAAGGDGETVELYYGALSVAVETIALLLFVEAFRRKLDHLAINRPIFIAVLDGVYRELATLGIVELFIHLLHEYAKNLDYEKEAVFVDVHFVFFYTAIFNAIQSTILAFLAHRVSYKIWVQTEEVELNHYVEIREEFDRVRLKLYGDDAPYSMNAEELRRPSHIVNSIKSYTDRSLDYGSNGSCTDPIKRFFVGVYYSFKYPRLKAKHDALLIQVRFHDLRVHFIQAYELPHKLKVSTYLMRSLQAVLKHLIHISTMAWLWLTGMINVLYFMVGIVVDITGDSDASGMALTIVFIVGMCGFILVSILLYRRMHIIFMQIMEMKHLWDVDAMEEPPESRRSTSMHNSTRYDYQDGPLNSNLRDPALASEQQKLFFLGDPKIIIVAIQFMQFGYAIGLSVVVVYWPYMNREGSFGGGFYLFMTLVSYLIFLIIMAQTLVKFTMATSLGQLVDRKRLHETVALYRLEEAERRRQQRMEMNMDFYIHPSSPQKSNSKGVAFYDEDPTSAEVADLSSAALSTIPDSPIRMNEPLEDTTASSINGDHLGPLPFQGEEETIIFEDKSRSPVFEDGTIWNEGEGKMVVTTTSLTSGPMLHASGNEAEEAPLPDAPKLSPKPTGLAVTTIPTGLAAIPEKQAMEHDHKTDTNSQRQAVPLDEIRRAERRDRRRNRRKSVSDGVALMSSVADQTSLPTINEPGNVQAAKGEAPFGRSQTEDHVTLQSAAAPSPKFAVDDSALIKRRERRQRRKKAVSASAAIQQMRDMVGSCEDPFPERRATIEPDKATLLMDLVKMDTDSLRQAVPLNEVRKPEQGDRRRNRKKAVSDGVGLMSMSAIGKQVSLPIRNKEPVNAKAKEAPFQRSQADDQVTRQASAPQTLSPKFAVDDSALIKRRERRWPRKKAVSASAAIRQMRDIAGFEGEEQKEPERSCKNLDMGMPKKSTTTASPPLNLFLAASKAQMSADDSTKSTATKSTTTACTPPPPNLFAAASKTQMSADDSAASPTAPRHRRERRNIRKKALSASAAVRLMRDTSEDEDEIQRERQSMMEFWGIPKKAPAGNDEDGSKQNASIESLQQSELLLQNQSFLATIEEHNNNSNTMMIPARAALDPVREVSMDFALSRSRSEDSSEQKEPPALNMLSHLDLSPKCSGEGTEPKRSSFTLPLREGECSHQPNVGWLDDDDDDETVETDRSVGGLSHVGEVDESNIRRHAEFTEDNEDERSLSLASRFGQLNDKLRSFFLSSRYTFITHLFGTMIVFFLMGMRVEGFLKQQCVIPLDDATWEFPLNTSFWMIFTAMLLFIVGSSWKVVLFPACLDQPEDELSDARGTTRERWVRLVAAVIDLIIVVCCFMLFIGAEIARCCDGNEYPSYPYYDEKYPSDPYHNDDYGHSNPYDHTDDGHSEAKNNSTYATVFEESHHEPATGDQYRFLAGSDYSDYEELAVCYDTTTYCNCPQFGTRVEGGLGAVEPWAALIILRMFRFVLARQIVQRFDLYSEAEETNHIDAATEGGKIQAHLTSHGHGHGGGNLETGTVVELWQAAVSQYPEIVDKYGEFSGELLQAMLGVEITGSHLPQRGPATREKPSSQILSEGATTPSGVGTASGDGITRATSSGILRGSSFENLPTSEHITLEEKKYKKLAPEVQEIIVAGKIGCPVKSCHNLAGLASRPPSSPDLLDPTDRDASLEFKVDVGQMEIDRLESTSAFEFPNARLVRSMRRCERKLLPLLSHWCPVDVVITNHEIVYVHIEGTDGDDHRLKEAGRKALSATKGGKGLRLADATAGRKIVGHLSFKDVITVLVERVHRLPESIPRSAKEATAELNHGHVEFWQEKPEKDRDESKGDRQNRWDSVHQDSLKIETIHGMLYLRFYSDLEDSEAHPERVIDESDEAIPVYKDIALQWAQTIIRQCPAGQLKQPLPNFCANNDAELKDFLQIIQREEKTRGRGHRRFASSGVVRIHAKSPRRARNSSRGASSGELPILSSDDIGATNKEEEHHLKSPPPMPQPRGFSRLSSYDEGDQGRRSSKNKAEYTRRLSG